MYCVQKWLRDIYLDIKKKKWGQQKWNTEILSILTFLFFFHLFLGIVFENKHESFLLIEYKDKKRKSHESGESK